jgi:hypothetical protein
MDRQTSQNSRPPTATESIGHAEFARADVDDALGLIACSIDKAAQAVGVSRTRIFDAVRKKELTARKAGRATIVEVDELKRWVRSLPVKGRESIGRSGSNDTLAISGA